MHIHATNVDIWAVPKNKGWLDDQHHAHEYNENVEYVHNGDPLVKYEKCQENGEGWAAAIDQADVSLWHVLQAVHLDKHAYATEDCLSQ